MAYRLLDCISNYHLETVRELLQNVEIEAYESNTRNIFLIEEDNFLELEDAYYNYVEYKGLDDLDHTEIVDHIELTLKRLNNKLKETEEIAIQIGINDEIKIVKKALIYTYFLD